MVSFSYLYWLKPLSLLCLFFFLPAKPQVLLVGQYSVGKTSFIRYLLGREFPGQRIGPEPTTDRFTGMLEFSSGFIALWFIHVSIFFSARKFVEVSCKKSLVWLIVLINGPEERTIPGNALSVHPDLPFRGLERFGVSFLSRFEGSQLPSSVLRSITMIDTPVRSCVLWISFHRIPRDANVLLIPSFFL